MGSVDFTIDITPGSERRQSLQNNFTLVKTKGQIQNYLDLVIDDASHLYELTRTSFVTLFPLLQPGGMYIIEDWAWSHRQNAQVGSHPWQDQPALTNLIYQLISELGGSNNIEDILINNNMVKIRKKKSAGLGSEVIQHSYLRGKKIPLIQSCNALLTRPPSPTHGTLLALFDIYFASRQFHQKRCHQKFVSVGRYYGRN